MPHPTEPRIRDTATALAIVISIIVITVLVFYAVMGAGVHQ